MTASGWQRVHEHHAENQAAAKLAVLAKGKATEIALAEIRRRERASHTTFNDYQSGANSDPWRPRRKKGTFIPKAGRLGAA